MLSAVFHGAPVASSGTHERRKRSIVPDDTGSMDDLFDFNFGPFKNANFKAQNTNSDSGNAASASGKTAITGAAVCMAAILN